MQSDDADDIALQYSSNITIMMWPSAYTDPAAGMKNVLATTTAKASLVQIGGSPGIELYPNTANNANPAWVEFVRDGVDVNIYSSTKAVEALVTVGKFHGLVGNANKIASRKGQGWSPARIPGWKWLLAASLLVLGAAAFALLLHFPRVECSYITLRPTVPCPQPSHLRYRLSILGLGALGAVGVLSVGSLVESRRS
jgi:hypothetical protein